VATRLDQAAGLQLPEVERLAAAVQLVRLRERSFAFRQGAACPRLLGVRSGLRHGRASLGVAEGDALRLPGVDPDKKVRERDLLMYAPEQV